ncbi:MAG: hypothetical protein ACKOE4_06255 [Candidatus Kapaibacterium sp.]
MLAHTVAGTELCSLTGVTTMHTTVRLFLLAATLGAMHTIALAQTQPVVATRWGLLLGGNFNMAGIG